MLHHTYLHHARTDRLNHIGERMRLAAADLGFATGVTTRPGVLAAADAQDPTALPRISVNGLWQSTEVLDVLLSGLAFAPWYLARAPIPVRRPLRASGDPAAPST